MRVLKGRRFPSGEPAKVYALPPPARTTPEAGLRRHPIWPGGPPRTTPRRAHQGPDYGPHRALRRAKRATDGAAASDSPTRAACAPRRQRARTGRRPLAEADTISCSTWGDRVMRRMGRARTVRASRPRRPVPRRATRRSGAEADTISCSTCGDRVSAGAFQPVADGDYALPDRRSHAPHFAGTADAEMKAFWAHDHRVRFESGSSRSTLAEECYLFAPSGPRHYRVGWCASEPPGGPSIWVIGARGQGVS